MQAWVVSLTPFDERGALDLAALQAHLCRMAASGIGVYVGSSNAGEGFTLRAEERAALFDTAAATLRGVVPVWSGGCEPQSLQAALAELQAAQTAGLDGAHLFGFDTGHAGPPTPAEIEGYYQAALESVTLPVQISNYPAMGYTLPLPLVARWLAAHPHLVGVRDASGDPGYLRELVAICRDRASVSTGGIRQLMSALHHGSTGFLSAEANLVPALAVAVLHAFEAGDLAALQRAHGHLFRLHEFLNRHGGSAGRGLKPLLGRLGLPGGHLRAPRRPLPEPAIDEMLAAYLALELPGAPRPAPDASSSSSYSSSSYSSSSPPFSARTRP